MAKKKVTIEDLARITKSGFDAVDKRFEQVDGKIGSFHNEMNARFEQVNARFDHIENLLIRAHENRIEKLEDEVKILKTLIGHKS
jgi:archaellum component FlaC